MTEQRSKRVNARKYDRWGITVDTYGSAFEGIGGDFGKINREASATELNLRSTHALQGAFPGAAVQVIAHDSVGVLSVTVVTPDEDQPDAPKSDDVQARARRLLHDVYQRMDWLVDYER